MNKSIIAAIFILVALTLGGCGEKPQPMAYKFNAYISKVAEYTGSYNNIQNSICAAGNKSNIEKNALLDRSIKELKGSRTGIDSIDPPPELANLKTLYLAANDGLVDSLELEKKQLLAKTPEEKSGLNEEEELVQGIW